MELSFGQIPQHSWKCTISFLFSWRDWRIPFAFVEPWLIRTLWQQLQITLYQKYQLSLTQSSGPCLQANDLHFCMWEGCGQRVLFFHLFRNCNSSLLREMWLLWELLGCINLCLYFFCWLHRQLCLPKHEHYNVPQQPFILWFAVGLMGILSTD